MTATLPPHADIVIAGAGFAGLATAAALVARGAKNVLVVEAEAVPGTHGSGRNAAMARRLIDDPLLAALACRSVAAMDAVAPGALRRVGGLLLGDEAALDRLWGVAQAVPALRDDAERMTAAQVRARVPALTGAAAEGGVWTPGCGVVDIHALLTALAGRAAEGGASLCFRAAVTAIERDRDGVCAVVLGGHRVATRCFVNAAGFSAGPIARLAGLLPPPLRPMRRHLYVTAPYPAVRRDAPFVWDTTRGFYFRPEGEGLLLCACDETLWPPREPVLDPGAKEVLAATFATHVPALAQARPTRGWCGLRVKTPDERFVIGPDPRLGGFVWVAGLGGHGMTTALGVGELGAAGILDGKLPAPFAAGFSPARFPFAGGDLAARPASV